MTEDQKHIWEREKRAVRQLRDGLDKPVDRRVVGVVAALRLIGIHTDASCGGHVDRAISPYVAFSSPQSRGLRRRADEDGDPRFRRRFLRRAAQQNAQELQRLLPYLDKFYRARAVPPRQRLIVQGFVVIGHRLTAQSADLVHVVSKDERHELVDVQRQEFDAFAEFLKAKFFGTKDGTPPRAA